MGIEVDQFLSWEGHISALIKKILSGIGILRHGKTYFPLTTIQSMYKSIIEPHFRFCCSLRGVCSATALNKLQRLQNRAARIAASSPYKAPSQSLLEKLGWQTVSELIDMETATMAYRSINNEAPDYLSTLFERLSQNTIKGLRNTKTDPKLPLLKTQMVRNASPTEEHDFGTTLVIMSQKRKPHTSSQRFTKLVGNPFFNFNFIAFKFSFLSYYCV